MNKIMRKKGFTIIELIVVIAILGILVLLAGPRLLGYVEKAELARIQHDVKVMENKMAEVLTVNNQEFDNFQNNGKDLGRVVMRKELYEKQGVAKNIDWEHLSDKWLQANNKDNHNELGMGGDLIELDDKYATYKIIPKEYSSKINTKLKGTFYVNSLGKVYYEHDKPLAKASEKEVLACVAPETLNYEFSIIDGKGTITKWNGTELHLIIPSSFLLEVDGVEQCVPVQVIGYAAFANGPLRSIVIPESVDTIEEDAFRKTEIIKITIPHSVQHIGDNAFADTPLTKATIINKPEYIRIGDNAFGGVTPTYKPPTAKDLNIIFDTKTNTIISGGYSGGSGGSSGNGGSGGSSSSGGRVVTIPKFVIVNGKEYPVKEISQGAYQGSGLISVIMPEGLERIEDYAFAGNQLIGVTIPKSVNYIGNYAFAFNEATHTITGDVKGTIKSIVIKGNQYINDIDGLGNITKPIDGITLKDHIFLTSSMGNHVIEDIGVDQEQPGDNNDEEDDNNDDSEVVAPGPGPSKPIEGATDGEYTFYGEVSTDDLIRGNELASKIGLTAGIAQHPDEPWLKFTREEDNGNITTMFVAKKPLRHSISWDQINAKGAVFGKTVEINGQTYKVRLMRGTLTNPSENNNSDRGAHGSEWNRMMLPIHERALPNKTWAHPKYVENDIEPFIHKLGSGKNGMYTDCDLLTHYSCGSGSHTLTQETSKSNASFRVFRGGDGVSNSDWSSRGSVASSRGWRPVLELVPAS